MRELTIAIPTLNCAPTLRATLESIRPLRDQGAKVVIADSFSTDGTYEIAKEFTEFVLQIPKGNMYAAINAGLRQVPAEWMTYINGDDLLFADSVQSALAKFSSETDVIYGTIDYIDLQGRFLHAWTSAPELELLPLFAQGLMPIPQQGTLFRRKVFEQLVGFDTQYSQSADFDFFLRAVMAGLRFRQIPVPRIGAFRIFPAQMSQAAGLDNQIKEAQHSIKKNQLTISMLARHLALLKFRLRNWDSYMIRLLRSRSLSGRYKFTATMDSFDRDAQKTPPMAV